MSNAQLVSNAAIGTIIAAVLQNVAYNRATTPPPGDNDYIPPVYWLNTIPMSAITQEVYELSAEATQHAIENGAIQSDHVILQPIRVEIEFEISNYDGLGARAQLAKTGLAKAIEMWMARKMFTLITTHTQLSDMVCLVVRAINEAPHWGKLAFRATFQQFKLVSLSVASFPKDKVQGAIGDNRAPEAAVTPGGPVTPKSAETASKPSTSAPRTVSKTQPLYAPKAAAKKSSSVNHGATGSWSTNPPPKSSGATGGW